MTAPEPIYVICYMPDQLPDWIRDNSLQAHAGRLVPVMCDTELPDPLPLGVLYASMGYEWTDNDTNKLMAAVKSRFEERGIRIDPGPLARELKGLPCP